jgi:hypothetical protein
VNIKISVKKIDYATLDHLLRLEENKTLSAPKIVDKYDLDVSAVAVSERRRALFGSPIQKKKRDTSTLRPTPCLCPLCRQEYTAKAFYTGRLPFRRFCDGCRNNIHECQWSELPESVVSRRIAMAV